MGRSLCAVLHQSYSIGIHGHKGNNKHIQLIRIFINWLCMLPCVIAFYGHSGLCYMMKVKQKPIMFDPYWPIKFHNGLVNPIMA